MVAPPYESAALNPEHWTGSGLHYLYSIQMYLRSRTTVIIQWTDPFSSEDGLVGGCSCQIEYFPCIWRNVVDCMLPQLLTLQPVCHWVRCRRATWLLPASRPHLRSKDNTHWCLSAAWQFSKAGRTTTLADRCSLLEAIGGTFFLFFCLIALQREVSVSLWNYLQMYLKWKV